MTPMNRKPRFFDDEAGTATVEAILWLPVFLIFFCLVADATMIFYSQNQALRLVQDVNRQMSVGRLGCTSGDDASVCEDLVEAKVLEAVTRISPNAAANTVIDEGMVTTVLTMPSTDLVATNLWSGYLDFTLTVGSEQLVEN